MNIKKRILKWIVKECLPSDHDISHESNKLIKDDTMDGVHVFNLGSRSESKGFEKGARWMRDLMIVGKL